MPAIIGALFSVIWMLVFLAFRPVTLVVALLACCSWLLLRDRRLHRRSRAVWLLPLLTALAINVHIFAVLVPCWIAALIAGDLIERRSPVRYLRLLGLSILALCATPMLRGIPATIAHLASSDVMVASGQVQELLPIWSDAYGLFIAITAAAAVAWIFYNYKLFGAGELIWLAGMITLLLRFGRFAPLFALIAAPLLARALPEMPDRILGRRVVGAACVAALAAGIWQTIASLPRSDDACAWLNRLHPGAPCYPCAAAEYVQRNISPHSRQLFNEMDFGGYLAWRLGAQWKVLLDGRTQCYPSDVWKANLGTTQQLRGFLAPLRADAAILPIRHSRFHEALKELGWRSVYQDDCAGVLVPPESENSSPG
jgi:hypothetical protein